jgi:hypothetical protein
VTRSAEVECKRKKLATETEASECGGQKEPSKLSLLPLTADDPDGSNNLALSLHDPESVALR